MKKILWGFGLILAGFVLALLAVFAFTDLMAMIWVGVALMVAGFCLSFCGLAQARSRRKRGRH